MRNDIVLSGNLQFIGLADIFQIIDSNNHNGTLRLMGADGLSVGIIYFVDGNPINAVYGSLYGIDAVNRMFGWMDGKFEFYQDRVQVQPTINLGAMRIVFDALRMLDEGAIERVGNGFRTSNLNLNNHSTSKNLVIKGPPIDYTYFLDEERFADGAKIVGQGEEGNWIWVVLEGTVKISRETPAGPVTLGLLGEGSFIGTFTSFKNWKNTRLANATAVGDVCLGVLDSTALYNQFCTLSSDFQKLLLSLTARMNKINDRRLRPPVQSEETDVLSEGGGSMFEEERLSNDVFSITNGEAYLFGKESNSNRLLFKLEKSDLLGRLPFCDIGQEPEYATVIPSGNLETQKISTDNIMKEYSRLPRVLRNMINNAGTCVAKTTLDYLQGDNVKPAPETMN